MCTSFREVDDGVYSCVEQLGEDKDFFLVSISDSALSTGDISIESIPVVDIYRSYLQNEFAYYKKIGEDLLGDGVQTHKSIGQFEFISWEVSKPGGDRVWAYLIFLVGNTMLKIGVQPESGMANLHQRAKAKALTIGLSIIGDRFGDH